MTKYRIYEEIQKTYRNSPSVLELYWDYLEQECGVERQTISFFIGYLGNDIKTYDEILYQATGYRNIEQLESDPEYR